jgi:hypothetical protein
LYTSSLLGITKENNGVVVNFTGLKSTNTILKGPKKDQPLQTILPESENRFTYLVGHYFSLCLTL